MALISFTLVAVLGCGSDYDIVDDNDVGGAYNPPDLGAELQEDRIVQVTIPSVDVLWVIDNSCSMLEEQSALTQNFGKFMAYFTDSGLDYHVGVVSTDMDSSRESGQLIVDQGTSYIDTSFSRDDAIASFSRRASLGTNGSATERGLDASWTALAVNGNGTNAGFYREEAAISIIAISDEDDQSTRVRTPEYISWVSSLKADLEMVNFSSIVGPDLGGGQTCNTAYEPGYQYIDVTNSVGGIEWSICSSDWETVLTELGLQAAGLKREFFLSEVPVDGSIAVTIIEPDGREYDDFVADDDYTYSRARNSITFVDYVPEPLSEVLITYEVLESAQIGEELDPTE